MSQHERRRLDPRLEKVVAGQRILLEQIARAVPLSMVLEQLVLLVESYASEGAMGCVHVVDAEGRLRVGAAPHLPASYRDAVDGFAVRDVATGETQPSHFLRGTVVSSDIGVDPGWDAVRDIALAAGLRSCWTTPLVSGDELLGTFALYFPHRREPDRQDRSAAEMIARTAVLAIDRDRVEQSRASSRRDESVAREDLQFVLDATTALARSLDRDRTVAMLAELALPRLAPLAAVDLVVDGTIVRAVVATAPGVPDDVRESVAAHDPRPESDHPAVRVLATGSEEVVLAQPGWMPGDVRGDADHVEALESLA